MFWMCDQNSVDNTYVLDNTYGRAMFAQHQGCLSLLCCPQNVGWECTERELGGDTVRIADPNWPKVIQYHMKVFSNEKTHREKGCLEVCLSNLLLQMEEHLTSTNLLQDRALFSWKWLNICLMMGRSELISCFALLGIAVFALPIKLSLLQPTRFLTFLLPVVFPTLRGNELAAVWVSLSSGVNSKQESMYIHWRFHIRKFYLS